MAHSKHYDFSFRGRKADAPSGPPPWFEARYLPEVSVSKRWQALYRGRLQAMDLPELKALVQQMPDQVHWHPGWRAAQEHEPVVLVTPPMQQRLLPAAECAEFQQELIQRDLAILQHHKQIYSVFFYCLLGLSLVMMLAGAGSWAVLMLIAALAAGQACFSAWRMLHHLHDTPALYLKYVGSTIRYSLWQLARPKALLWQIWMMAGFWLMLPAIKLATRGGFLSGMGQASINAAALIKSDVTQQPWRLLGSAMVHASIWQLLVAMLVLALLAPLLARQIQHRLLLPLWLLSALGGSLFSWLLSAKTTLGAMPGMLGWYGFLLAATLLQRRQFGPQFGQTMLRTGLILLALLVLGWKQIDQIANLGGLLTGGMAGLLLFGQTRIALPMNQQNKIGNIRLHSIGLVAELGFVALSLFVAIKLSNH